MSDIKTAIPLTVIELDTKFNVLFQLKKIDPHNKDLTIAVFLNDEEVSALKIKMEDFNNFCLDIFQQHKQIMEQ